ncbi:epidermal growth factor-like protein [Pleurodeles waltl]|uniref:epidermal growth factor-like protein n=1 Tax=Pleurodeles waltl TaxID=8319 RepID=UPI0037095ED4
MVKPTYYLLGLAAVLIAMLGTIKCDDDDGNDDIEKCDENMEFSPCGRSCQRTCQNISNMGPTKSCTEECQPGCSCVFGYVLQNGKCIPEKNCPCTENAEYKECGGVCRFTCEDVANMGAPKICPMICTGGCACKDGYALQSGKCIPQKECPCKENAQYNDCGTCRRTCEDVANNVTEKPCTKDCKYGCFCNKGYVLNSTECVLEKECPCNNHAHYETCGTACPITCDNHLNPPKSCIEPCVLGCFCDKGYVKSGNTCVRPEQCPRTISS